MSREEIFARIASGDLDKESALKLLHGGGEDVDRPRSTAVTTPVASGTALPERVQGYLVARLAGVLEVPESEIDVEANLMDLGLDSTKLIQLAEQFEDELGITLYPTVFFEHQTLAAVAGYFAEEHAAAFETTETVSGEGRGAGSHPPAREFDAAPAATPAATTSATPATPLPERVQGYLVARLAGVLEVPESEIDVEANLMDLGLDSTKLIQLAEQFEDELGITLYPTVFFEHQTLAAVAEYFAEEHAIAFESTGAADAAEPGGVVTPPGADSAPVTSASAADHPASHEAKAAAELPSVPEDTYLYTYDWRDWSSRAVDAGASGAAVIHAVTERDAQRVREVCAHLPGRSRRPIMVLEPQRDLRLSDGRTRSLQPDEARLPAWLGQASADGRPVHRVAFFIAPSHGEGPLADEPSRAVAYSALDLVREVGDADGLEIVFVVERGEKAETAHAALAALAATIRTEYPRVATRTALVDAGKDTGLQVAELLNAPMSGASVVRSGDGGRWEERVVREQADVEPAPGAVIRQRGVYLLTGGAGGLGALFAEYLAGRYQARLVLSGRRPEDERIRALLERIRAAGGEARYVSGDIADRSTAQRLVETTRREFGMVNGVLHAAGVLRDAAIARKRHQEFAEVADPKVRGALLLDELTADDPLDLFVTFSSMAAVTGNHGQSDYTYANGFLDGFATCRASLVASGRRAGRCLSLQWPLWAEGGMRPHESAIEYMRRQLGLDPLSTKSGMAAFEVAVAAAQEQLLVVQGDRSRIAGWLQPVAKPQPRQSASPEVPTPDPVRTTAARDDTDGDGGPAGDDIAVIGLQGEFPGSPDLDAFWENLVAGKDLIGTDPERWNLDGLADLLGIDEASQNAFVGGFTEFPDAFDAEFFRISTAEAQMMDPQQRRFLQAAWGAVEDAGYDPFTLAGSATGVFVGASTRDYLDRAVALGSLLGEQADLITPQTSTGMALNNIPNRLSYFLDLNGPSEAVDTACSSSLVALDRAVSALQRGDCELAIVGGVNLLLSPGPFWSFARTGILSADSRCRSFAADANGYVRGEGVGVVVLKARTAAERDGDCVRALIKGTAVNHGGRVQSLTAPNPTRQADVIARAIRRAGVSPSTIGYIEAHGTGTALGDPVEIRGLRRAFTAVEPRDDAEPSCSVGSVKSNIGHLEAAAGIAGLIKALLCMRYATLAKSVHIDRPNPYLDLESSSLYLQRETGEWPRLHSDAGEPLPYRAGVSSFGFGGTNAHVILEEYPRRPSGERSAQGPVLIVLSARSTERLREYAGRLRDHLTAARNRGDMPELADIAYTLQVGRPSLQSKLALIVDDADQAIAALSAYADTGDASNVLTGEGESSRALADVFDHPYGAEFLRRLYDDGRLEAIARLWLSGVDIDWQALNRGGRRIPLPTYPFSRTRYWLRNGAGIPATQPTVQPTTSVASAGPSRPEEPQPERDEDLRTFLIHQVANLLKLEADSLNPDRSLADYGLDSILGMQLVASIQRRLDIPVYAAEIMRHGTINRLAAYLDSETGGDSTRAFAGETSRTPAPEAAAGETLTEPMVFVLSTPRAGSTLLRAMLQGHPGLFAPPELHLLGYGTLQERRTGLAETGLEEGLIDAVRHLRGVSAEVARAEIEAITEEGGTIADAYRLLQSLAAPASLVDKSPTYGRDPEVLRQSRELCPNARYVHLVRDPRAVAESIVRNRFHRLIDPHGEDPWQTAEAIWRRINRNVIEFLRDVPDGNQLTVRYEDLVRDPQSEMHRICEFLGVTPDREMLDPYGGERMLDGLHEGSLSIGDPNFLQHEQIDTSLAQGWGDRLSDDFRLTPEGGELAVRFGYADAVDYALSAGQSQSLARGVDERGWYLIQRFVLNEGDGSDVERLREAVATALRSQPQLRSLLTPDNTALRPADPAEELIVVRQAEAGDGQRADVLEAVETELAESLDPQRGPLAGAALIDEGPRGSRVSLVWHHLFVDGLSAVRLGRAVIDDYAGSRERASTGDGVAYAQYLAAVARLNDTGSGVPEWIARQDYPSPDDTVPVALDGDNNSHAVQQEVEVDASDLLAEGADTDAGYGLFESLGAALADTLMTWGDTSRMVLSLRLHGRDLGDEGVFADAVGNLACDVPILVERGDGRSFAAGYAEIDRTGVGYELLRRRGEVPAPWEVACVRFNYQPFGNETGALEAIFERGAANGRRRYLLDFVARHWGGRLVLLCRYSARCHRGSTARHLLEAWVEAAREAQYAATPDESQSGDLPHRAVLQGTSGA
ncbi:SDR family NAD(P)-dependent oxidoreductase [Arhodomonas sp. AD133]|uniref:SDR family NAD(P)-dependent oxidoreductase n=1 Tax=Arhodomonas sp. AD133 TaxID=3415009 RepID=UPI003EBDE620